MKKTQKRGLGGKIANAVFAGVLTVGLMPSFAFAADRPEVDLDLSTSGTAVVTQEDGDNSGGMSIEGLVLGAAHAAANPAPEILGLSNPNQRSDSEGETTYNFFGDPDVNSAPDPFLYNAHNKYTPSFVLGGRTGQSPESGLSAYDTTNPKAAQNAVWAFLPQVVLGTGSLAEPEGGAHDYYANMFKGNAEALAALGVDSYEPIGVTYNRNNLPTMIQTMYNLAEAANEAIADSGNKLQTRYGDPMEIAKDYERYIVGAKGVVKQAIDTGAVEQKTIALVENYDSASNTFVIISDGVPEGTATTNRYLEAVQGVTCNYFDTVGAAGASAVTAQQLADNVDVIIVGSNTGVGGTGGAAATPLMEALSNGGLLDKTYYCTNWSNGSAFGTTVNSVENAQNIGRILPCVYPEVLDQSDMIAYYYDTFYHVKTGTTATLIADRMDGVRNWAQADSAAYTEWQAGDVDGYTQAGVENLLKSGIAYLSTQRGLSSYLTPTANLTEDFTTVDLAEATITVPAGVLEDGVAEPEPIVTYGATTLVKDTDYTVAYKNNEAVGTATLTITAVDGSGFTGTKSAEFKVVANDNFSNLEAAVADDEYFFTGNPIEPVVTITGLEEGKDFVVNYVNNINAAEATAENAPTAIATGIGDYAGTISKPFTIKKAAPVATISVDKAAYTYGDAITVKYAVDSAYTSDGGKTAITSSNENVLALVNSGRGSAWTIVGAGSATLTISGDATANCNAPSAKVDVTVAKATPTITIGAATNGAIVKANTDAAFSLEAAAAKGTTKYDGTLAYQSSDPAVATVAADGTVTIVGTGTTTLTVSAPATDNFTAAADATATLTVKADISDGVITGVAPAYDYTGEVLLTAAQVGFMLDDQALVPGTDFIVKITDTGKTPKDYTESGVTDKGSYNVTVTGTGDYIGSRVFGFRVASADDYFTVKVQENGETTVARTFTRAEFEALAASDPEPISALYGGTGNWSVATAKTYVTAEKLLEGAGVAAKWADGSAIKIESGNKGTAYYTYGDKYYFYPETTNAEDVATTKVEAPLVFSLSEYSGKIGANQTAADVEAANVANANGANTPRVIVGMTEDAYAAGSAAGWRLWSSLGEATLIVCTNIAGGIVTGVQAAYDYTGNVLLTADQVGFELDGVALKQGQDFTVKITDTGKTPKDYTESGVTDKGSYNVTVTGINEYTGSKTFGFRVASADDYFTVKVQENGETTVARTFSRAEFEALAAADPEPISALYGGTGSWQVATAKTYVTAEKVLEAAGVADEWADGASLKIESGNKGTAYYDYGDKYYFYPETTSAEDVATVKTEAPLVFSLSEYSGKIGAGQKASDVEAANVANANGANTPRVIVGMTEDAYAAGSAAGWRLWSSLGEVTLVVYPDLSKATVTAPSQTYTGSALVPDVTVVLNDSVVDPANYDVAITDASGQAVEPVNAGDYTITVTGKGNYKGTGTGTFTVAKAASTVTLSNKTTTYTGKTINIDKAKVTGSTGKVTYTYYTDKACTKKASAHKNAGTYYVKATVAADANYNAATSKAAKLTINKANNTLVTKSASKKLTYSKSKNQSFQAKSIVIKTAGKGTTTYKIKSVPSKYKKYISVTSAGKVTVKKGAPKGTCKLKLTVKAAGNSNYKASATKTPTITITVK